MPHDVQSLWKLDLELWNSGKSELATEVYTAQAEHHEPGYEPIHGPKEIAQRISALRAAFPDFRMELTRTLTEGGHFALCWTCYGTHQGMFQGIPPTGKRVELHGVTVGRTSHGRIHDERVYFDRVDLLEQLGVMGAAAHQELAAAR